MINNPRNCPRSFDTAHCVFKDGPGAVEAFTDDVVLRLWGAQLGLYGVDLCSQFLSGGREEVKISCLCLILAEELTDGTEIQVAAGHFLPRAGLPLWMADPMMLPWTLMTEMAGGKCCVGSLGAVSDCSISLMPQ